MLLDRSPACRSGCGARAPSRSAWPACAKRRRCWRSGPETVAMMARHREPEPVLAECRARRLRKGVVARGDDLVHATDSHPWQGDEQIEHEADGDGDDDGPSDIAVRIDDLLAAVGDGGEAFVGQRTPGAAAATKPVDAEVSWGSVVCDSSEKPASPQAAQARRAVTPPILTKAITKDSASISRLPDRFTAKAKASRPTPRAGTSQATVLDVEELQSVGAEGARHQTLVDDHGEVHEQAHRPPSPCPCRRPSPGYMAMPPADGIGLDIFTYE